MTIWLADSTHASITNERPIARLLKELLEVHSLEASSTDYRKLKGKEAASGVYFLDGEAATGGGGGGAGGGFEAQFTRLTGGAELAPLTVTTEQVC